MAGTNETKIDGKVAFRLFILIVGVLFIWNSIPSHRWTKNVSSNIETGPWTTCSCVDNTFNDCVQEYSAFQSQLFKAGDKENDNRDKYRPLFYLFPKVAGKDNVRDVYDSTSNVTLSDIKNDGDQCDQYNASGAIAFIAYIFGFLAVLAMVKNVASNSVPVVGKGVFGLILMSGIWGLIATCMFGDLFGSGDIAFGYHFGLFVFAWCCFVVVGFTGMRANVGASQAQAAILMCALTAYAFSMGNNWYVRDQQDLVAPINKDWNIKAGTFFIEPMHKFAFVNADITIAQLNESMMETFDVKKIGDCPPTDSKKEDKKQDCVKNPTTSATSPFFPNVNGFIEIGMWNTCYCKNTLTMECTMFGSHEIMFNGQTDDCNNFNVARALILITGILALFSLVLASALIGGLRKVSLHRTSNTLALLAAFTGFIASILYGAVLYDVDDLGRDYAIFLAGWWLCFFAAIIGKAADPYYTRTEETKQITPLTAVAQNPEVSAA
jgi:hypothetical protein